MYILDPFELYKMNDFYNREDNDNEENENDDEEEEE